MNYFASPVNIDNRDFIVEFDTVKNNNTGDEHFRLKRLYSLGNEKRTGSGGLVSTEAKIPLGTTSSSGLNIPQTNQNVNDISTNSNMQQLQKNSKELENSYNIDMNSNLRYNNINEEGVQHEKRIDSRATGGIASNSSERTLGKNGQNIQGTREYSKQEYNKYEQSAAKNRVKNITPKQQQLQTDKILTYDIRVFFDEYGDNNNRFRRGALYRAIRKKFKRELDDDIIVAELLGIGKNTLKSEKGIGEYTINRLEAILNALGYSLDEELTEEQIKAMKEQKKQSYNMKRYLKNKKEDTK